MSNKPKMVVFRVQEELYKDFVDKCEKNYKSVSEVLRDSMSQYIKEKENAQRDETDN